MIAMNKNTGSRVRLTFFNLRVVALTIVLFAIFVGAVPAAQAQTFTVLYEFTPGGNGYWPVAGVVLDSEGNVYGATQYGGSFDYGTVFKLDPAGKHTVLHSFLGSDGLYPAGALLRDAQGNLYGTTSNGGTAEGGKCLHGCGTVFKIDAAGKQTILYPFAGSTDGGLPYSRLLYFSGDIYGTTAENGDPSCYVNIGCGVVFQLSQSGQETVLHSFTDKTDGKSPAGLVADGTGNFYGTTYDGGSNQDGAIFKVNTSGEFTVLYSFTGGADSGDPAGGLVRDRAGNLYGTTYGVGIGLGGCGIVYKLDTAGNFTVLYTFTCGTDGQYPGGMVMDAKGNLYGTAEGGGTGTGCYYGGCGTIFEIDTGNNFSVLHSFVKTDGELPIGLTIDSAGNLYGATLGGGLPGSVCHYYDGCGTVFKFTP